MSVTTEQSDVAILASVARGDRSALEALYHRHANTLWRRLYRRCPDADIVDTALQDTFIAVWRFADRYRPEGGDVGAWLWTVAVRKLIDQLRKRRPPSPMASLPEPEPLPPPGTPAFELLSRLPPDLHDVVRAVYLDGLTTAEAAVLLSVPQGTVKSRLARARPLLQKDLR